MCGHLLASWLNFHEKRYSWQTGSVHAGGVTDGETAYTTERWLCGFILCYANFHLLLQIQAKQKIQYRKFGIAEQTQSNCKNIYIPWITFILSQNGVLKLNATYHKSCYNENIHQNFWNARSCIAELERGSKALQFDVCCKAIDQNCDCGCDRHSILCLNSLRILCIVNYGSLVETLINSTHIKLKRFGSSFQFCW